MKRGRNVEASVRDASLDLSLTGFDEDELEKLLAGEDLVDALEEGETPAPPKKQIMKPGDVWRLGDHRLACGDSTDVALIRRAVAGTLADSMVTYPPYGVDYSSTALPTCTSPT